MTRPGCAAWVSSGAPRRSRWAAGSAWWLRQSFGREMTVIGKIPSAILSGFLVAACAGQTDSATPEVSVRVSPTEAHGTPHAVEAFSDAVTGTANTAVTWSVEEGSAGGSVTATGLYTAPGSAGTYHVVVTSQANTTASAAATVTITETPAVVVTVSPQTVSVVPGGVQQFTASVTGSTNTAVTWSLQASSGCGSVSPSGLYTAPAAAGICHVVATSQADASANAIATVTVATQSSVVAAMPRITVPTSLIFGSDARVSTLNDGAYRYNTFTPGSWSPGGGSSWWAALNVGKGPTTLLLSWTDEDSGVGDFTNASFQDYTIQTCAVSPDNGTTCSDSGGWTTAITVTANPYLSRVHLIPFSGKAWLKWSIRAARAAWASLSCGMPATEPPIPSSFTATRSPTSARSAGMTPIRAWSPTGPFRRPPVSCRAGTRRGRPTRLTTPARWSPTLVVSTNARWVEPRVRRRRGEARMAPERPSRMAASPGPTCRTLPTGRR